MESWAADIQVTTTGVVDEINAGSIFLTGTLTGAPEATATNSNTASASITTNITTLTNNAWLIDVVGSGNGGSFTAGGGQTERWDASAASGTGAASSKPVASAGLSSMTQTHSTTSNRNAHGVIAVAPAVASTIAFDSAGSANTTGSNSINWTHNPASGSTMKLIVGIAIKDGCTGNEVITAVTYAGVALTQALSVKVPVTGFCQQVEIWYLDLIAQGQLQTYFAMDETWTVPATGVVTDRSGNMNHGDTISVGAGTTISNGSANPVFAGDPGTCGYGSFPLNTSQTRIHAVNSTIIPADAGAVTFWYRSDAAWTAGGNRKLLDASTDATNRFFLTKMNNGRLRFRLEVGGSVSQAQTAIQTFVANTWVHIGITWDLDNDQTEVYINGILRANSTSSVGTGSGWNTLYIGDNRANLGGQGNTGRSAGGLIDEVRIYDGVIPQATIDLDRNSTHPCALLNHYAIGLPGGTSASICEALIIQISAHDIAHNSVIASAAVVLAFTTSTGLGTWETPALSGSGIWTPSGSDDGNASYTWPAGENTLQVELSYASGTVAGLSVDLADSNGANEGGSEDPSMDFISAGTAIRVTADGASGTTIGTQLAGKDSDTGFAAQTLFIQAIAADCGNFGGPFNNIAVGIVSECNDPTTCAGQQVSIEDDSMTMIAITSFNNGDPLNFAGSTVQMDLDFETKTPLVFNYADAGIMTLHFQITVGPGFTGSSNAYVVRPFGFRIDNFSPGNAAATDENGGVFTQAGNPFTADISAVVWQSADDDGSTGGTANDGIADSNAALSGNNVTPNFGNETTAVAADLSHTLVAPIGGDSGILTGDGSFSGFSSGVVTAKSISWDEVGILQLDVNESNNDYLGGLQDIVGQVPFVGRFIPANLTVAVQGTTSFADSCAAGGFTHQDQTFYYAGPAARLRIRGVNTSGANTINYDNVFFKLQNTILPRSYSDQTGAAANFEPPIIDTDVNILNLGAINGRVDLRLQNGTNGDAFMYSRVTEEGSFTASVQLTFDGEGFEDDDGVCYDGDNDGNCEGSINNDDDFVYGTISGTELRFARLAIGSEVGTEIMALDVALTAQYFNGTSYMANSDDTCTSLSATDFVLSNQIESGQADATIDVSNKAGCADGTSTMTVTNEPFVLGEGLLAFTAPGTACTGFADITVDLSLLLLDYLQFDWDDDDGLGNGPYDGDPVGRASFGIISRPKEIIYTREPW